MLHLLVLFLHLYFCVCKYFSKNPYDNLLFGFSILGVLYFPFEGDLYSQMVGVEMRPRLPTQQYNTLNPFGNPKNVSKILGNLGNAWE